MVPHFRLRIPSLSQRDPLWTLVAARRHGLAHDGRLHRQGFSAPAARTAGKCNAGLVREALQGTYPEHLYPSRTTSRGGARTLNGERSEQASLQVCGVRVFLGVIPACHSLQPLPAASPCAEASKASMDCMNHHDYDRDKCLDYFRAYRDCKKAWVSPHTTFRHKPLA